MSESMWLQELSRAARPQTSRELAAQGVGEGTLRGRRWRRVARGIYAPAVNGTLSAGQRILDASSLLAGGPANGGWAIGGWAAAYVLGVDWLDGQDPHTGQQLPIDLIAPQRRRANTEMITYRHCPLPEDDVIMSSAIAVTSLERTAFDGARWASNLEEAVVFLDSVLAFETVSADLLMDGFQSYIARHKGWVGIDQAKCAAEMARRGVASGWESRLRMCWLHDARLPEPPLINVPVFGLNEELLGIADLFDPEAAFVAEYDGAQHRDPQQHRRDNIREERFESANITVARADRVDVRSHRGQLARRLRDGHRRGMLRDRGLDRWTLRQPVWWLVEQQQHGGRARRRDHLRRLES